MGDISDETLALRAKTEQKWALAKLKSTVSGRAVSLEILDWIGRFIEQERAEARTKPDNKLIMLKCACSVRRCYEALSQNGFPEFERLFHELDDEINKITVIVRRLLIRRLVSGELPKPVAEEVVKVLRQHIDQGLYDTWPDDWAAAVEAAQSRQKSG
jgi:hypothetical protein